MQFYVVFSLGKPCLALVHGSKIYYANLVLSDGSLLTDNGRLGTWACCNFESLDTLKNITDEPSLYTRHNLLSKVGHYSKLVVKIVKSPIPELESGALVLAEFLDYSLPVSV